MFYITKILILKQKGQSFTVNNFSLSLKKGYCVYPEKFTI